MYEGQLDVSMFETESEDVLLYAFFTLFEQSPGSAKHKTIADMLQVAQDLAS